MENVHYVSWLNREAPCDQWTVTLASFRCQPARTLVDGRVVPEGAMVVITIESRVPDKWLFVDLEGSVWISVPAKHREGREFRAASQADLAALAMLLARKLANSKAL